MVSYSENGVQLVGYRHPRAELFPWGPISPASSNPTSREFETNF